MAEKKTTKKTTAKSAKKSSTDSSNRRKLVGVVRKKSGDNTVSVTVERFIKHPVYGKYYRSSKNYASHDADNTTNVGDQVEITETKPMSKTKHFVVSNIIKAAETAE